MNYNKAAPTCKGLLLVKIPTVQPLLNRCSRFLGQTSALHLQRLTKKSLQSIIGILIRRTIYAPVPDFFRPDTQAGFFFPLVQLALLAGEFQRGGTR
jgi:hypothetical protein